MKNHNENRIYFELFKSNVCHELKRQGDIAFIAHLLETNLIGQYYTKRCYPECLYLLEMLDYLSRENNVETCSLYDDMRKLRLKFVLYPSSVLAVAKVTNNDDILKQSIIESIPEFIRFNIVEKDIRNVV